MYVTLQQDETLIRIKIYIILQYYTVVDSSYPDGNKYYDSASRENLQQRTIIIINTWNGFLSLPLSLSLSLREYVVVDDVNILYVYVYVYKNKCTFKWGSYRHRNYWTKMFNHITCSPVSVFKVSFFIPYKVAIKGSSHMNLVIDHGNRIFSLFIYVKVAILANVGMFEAYRLKNCTSSILAKISEIFLRDISKRV